MSEVCHNRFSKKNDRTPSGKPHVFSAGGRCVFCDQTGTRPSPDREETQVRRGARPTEISGAERGLPASGTHRRIALDFIVRSRFSGATNDEISRYMEEQLKKYVPPNQVASRVGELVKDGYVVDSGVTRKTRRGSDAVVWVDRDMVSARAGQPPTESML